MVGYGLHGMVEKKIKNFHKYNENDNFFKSFIMLLFHNGPR